MPANAIDQTIALPDTEPCREPWSDDRAPSTPPTPPTAKTRPISPLLNPSSRLISRMTTAVPIAAKRFDVAVQNATARMPVLVPDEAQAFADVVHETRAARRRPLGDRSLGVG